MQTIAERLRLAQNTIRIAANNSQREYHCVKLLAVSKMKPVSDIVDAYAAGQRSFGENYVQEGIEKIQHLSKYDDIEWHMIGPLQSNKTKQVAEHFDWVQSVDREKIAIRLNNQRPNELPPLNVCIQVNIDDEDSKSGVKLAEIDSMVEYISTLPRLKLRGLMAIPAANASATQQAKSYTQLQEVFAHYQSRTPDFDTMSLGMSQDLAAAIAHGSTMVRLGTAIFGPRN